METRLDNSCDRARMTGAERVAWSLTGLAGAAIGIAVLVIFAGSIFRPQSGLLADVLSDRHALLWITGASTTHLVFVPCLCIGIALRDRRRMQGGIPIPEPRSIWRGHASVFDEPKKAA